MDTKSGLSMSRISYAVFTASPSLSTFRIVGQRPSSHLVSVWNPNV